MGEGEAFMVGVPAVELDLIEGASQHLFTYSGYIGVTNVCPERRLCELAIPL